jgi:hypothetical protein
LKHKEAKPKTYITFFFFHGKVKQMGIMNFLRQEFSFISGNYRILIISWIIMDIAMEMPAPNYQYYVQALEGTGMALGIIGCANFLALAAVAFPGATLRTSTEDVGS